MGHTMKPLDIEKMEQHPDTAELIDFFADCDSEMTWTRLFSAHGKHGDNVRGDPVGYAESRD